MATRTRSRSTTGVQRSRSETGGASSSAPNRSSRHSAFGLNGQGTTLATAALAGAAIGLAANLGRKFVVQGMAAASGDWSEQLAAEHAAVLAIFEKIEATNDTQTTIRAHLLAKLKNALGKHAIEEENVIYPALREANSTHDADALNAEHGYVKTYLYELENMRKDSPDWIARVRDFRAMIQEHMKMEEDEVFPGLKRILSEEQNAKLTAAMNREGRKLA